MAKTKQGTKSVEEVDLAIKETNEKFENALAELREKRKAELAELREMKKEAAKREKQRDEELRAEASFTIGEAIVSLYGKGWRTIDFDGLARVLSTRPELFPMRAEASLEDAKAALKRFNSVVRRRQDGPGE